ncbi:MAG: GNAT family N-acetyltransferase [Bradymonadia bacterium]
MIELQHATPIELNLIQELYRIHLGQTVDIDWLVQSCSSTRDILYVLYLDGVLGGFVHAVWSGGPYELLGICVRPDLRRRGLAFAGITRLLSELRQKQVAELWLEVRADNHGAYHLYKETGAIETGRRSRYYPDGMDALLMTYVIDSRS